MRVFDGKKWRSGEIGEFEPPDKGNRVHRLEIDAKGVKPFWEFTLWKDGLTPVKVFAKNDVFIFARRGKGKRVVWIGWWKLDCTRPSFVLDQNDTTLYVVEADTQEEAGNLVSTEFHMQVSVHN